MAPIIITHICPLLGNIKKNFTPKVIAIAKPIHKSMWIAMTTPKNNIAKCNAK
jgi:hypothetical protein